MITLNKTKVESIVDAITTHIASYLPLKELNYELYSTDVEFNEEKGYYYSFLKIDDCVECIECGGKLGVHVFLTIGLNDMEREDASLYGYIMRKMEDARTSLESIFSRSKEAKCNDKEACKRNLINTSDMSEQNR